MRSIVHGLWSVVFLLSCGGKPPPPTRYYQLAMPEAKNGSVTVEPLETEGMYDDERMVYRTSPYRLEYYEYHRWSAPPGQLVASYLERALSGRVDRALTISGRVLAIEEVDVGPHQWVGRLSVELVARDASGKTIWTDRFDETAPMPRQSPEGLAAAITADVQKIAAQVSESKQNTQLGSRDR